MFNTESTALKLLKAELKAQNKTLDTLRKAAEEKQATDEMRREIDQNNKAIKQLKAELGLN